MLCEELHDLAIAVVISSVVVRWKVGDKGGSVGDGLVDDGGDVIGDGGRLVVGVGAAGV